MAIRIQSGKNNILTNSSNSTVQSVPFKIDADCDAPVRKYFQPFVQKTENNVLTASFRGYPLKGTKIQLPEGYQGMVLHESLKPDFEKLQDRHFFVVNKFEELTFWNWDKIPSKNDVFLKALDWIDIAEALHRPGTEQ
ncbi:hypothetical protein ABEB36_001856 [Hypothenemus hampei]|uniref:Uncharacterized protein n=1 Tax=Hypothenemus hampei TaxID=57062 RepID=A0ABD1FH00_HYPHA